MPAAKLILGCGYVGGRVAQSWLATGDTVYVLTRSETRRRQLAGQGLRPLLGDLARDDLQLTSLAGISLDTVLFAVGYDRHSAHSLADVYVGGLRRALERLPAPVDRFIYISSTGVFGQDDGGWVDETSPCRPTREGGRACLAAERLLAEHPLGARAVVLRLAGIYGPGRLPRQRLVERGEPVPGDAEATVNLIHVEDAVRAVLSAEKRAVPPCLYLVGDGRPVRRRDFYGEMARLLRAPPPRFQDPPSDRPPPSRGGSNKRISNARMLRDLQLELAFPSYREGLAAILARSR